MNPLLPLDGARPRGMFVRMFSSAVISQALLSGASLGVGLLLIRHTSDAQYGSYILVTVSILLLTSLQSAFFGPAMINRITHLDQLGRGAVMGGLYREQRRLLGPLAILLGGLAILLHAFGALNWHLTLLLLAAIAAAIAALNREFFRTCLLAQQRSQDVLRADFIYVTLLIAGVALATMTPVPAATAALAIAVAACAAGEFLARILRNRDAWDIRGAPGILREIAPLAAWSTAGAAIHWTFSQGYSYLVAGTLDVTAVAAIAGTRMLLMPVNLLSTGIGSLMLPLVSSWLRGRHTAAVFQRLLLFAGVLALVSLTYLGLMWWLRDWIFASLLKKQFAQRDTLLMLWSAVALLMVLRDQLIYILIARQRFRRLTALTLASALLSLGTSYWGMLHFGVVGALLGVLIGEIVNVGGIVVLSLDEIRRAPSAPVHGPDCVAAELG